VITLLLIVHSLCAVFMLGALTHQALSVWWPVRAAAGPRSLFTSFRAVRSAAYANTIVVLYVVTASLGAIMYPTYRLAVRVVLEDLRLGAANGIFEMKEHFVAVGLGLLPAYWYYWRQPPGENATAQRVLTLLLALIVWWAFLVGHILNNIRGFGS
jgi:hypothetical protein